MLKRYSKLYFNYIKLNFKALLSYRADFIIGSFGFVISSIALLISLLVIYQIVDDIGGWTQTEVIFLFAFVSLTRSIWNTFMFNMMSLGSKIKTGSFDIYLFRPVNTLFQLLSEKIDPDTIGEVFFSSILFVYCLFVLDLFYIGKLFLILILMISSVLCFAAIHLTVNTISFWIIENSSLNFIIWRLDELTMYPFSIYPRFLQYLLTIIPFGFVGYYPLTLLLTNKEGFEMLQFISPLAGLVSFSISYLLWKKGLKNYQSTGS